MGCLIRPSIPAKLATTMDVVGKTRRAGTDEVDLAMAVWGAANPSPAVPEHATWLRGRAADPDTLLLVAEDAGQLAGMVLVLPGRSHDGAGDEVPGHVHLTGMAVRPEHQRSGLGSALLDAALGEAMGQRAVRVTLWAAENNVPTRRLLTSRGFRFTGRSACDAGGKIMCHFERLMP